MVVVYQVVMGALVMTVGVCSSATQNLESLT